MTTIYRQELDVKYNTPECNRRIAEFTKLTTKELFTKLAQAKRNLKRLRRIYGDLHAVDRLTAEHAIGEIMKMEYYRDENIEKAILEPRLLIEKQNGDKIYSGQTKTGLAYSIETKTHIDGPGQIIEEVILYVENTPPMTLYVDWPEIPETKVLRLIEWVELV